MTYYPTKQKAKERLRKTLSQAPTPQRSTATVKDILTPHLAMRKVEGRLVIATISRKAEEKKKKAETERP